MVSDRRLAANRSNALRSTGPKTPQGKAAVRHNALKHALLAKEVVITTGDGREDPDEFSRLHAALTEDLQPVGLLEDMLVEKIAVSYWRLRRLLRVETAEIRRRYGLPAPDPPAPPSLDPNLFAVAPPSPRGASSLLQHTSAGLRHLLCLLAHARSEAHALGCLSARVRDRVLAAFGTDPDTLGGTCLLYNSIITDRENLAERLAQSHPNAPLVLPPPEKCSQAILAALDQESRRLTSLQKALAQRESAEHDLRRPCLAVPPPDAADALLRYETALDRQLYKAMAELERLQRRRLGDAVSPPLDVQVSHN